MMTSRRGGKASSNNNNWDPMRTEYESQEAEDESGSGGLDHCRLYVTSIPKGLNEEGFQQLFLKYGTLMESHLSSDPSKRYGLVRFESPAEAKLAMMTLNQTEPLNLNIRIANKTAVNKRSNTSQEKPKRSNKKYEDKRQNNGYREFDDEINENNTVSARGSYARSEITTRDDETSVKDLDDMIDVDPDLELQVAKIRQLMYSQRQKIIEKKMAATGGGIGNRSFMPDGKIVVRNDERPYRKSVSWAYEPNEKQPRDGDINFSGDSYAASRACVNCGAPADSYCARCGLTPYCSVQCQRRDWARRHSAVCHNLARNAMEKKDVVVEGNHVDVPPFAPLRPARSPLTKRTDNYRKPDAEDEDLTLKMKMKMCASFVNRPNKKFVPTYNIKNSEHLGRPTNNRDNRGQVGSSKQENLGRPTNNRDGPGHVGSSNRSQNQTAARSLPHQNQMQAMRRPYHKQESIDDEDWGTGKKEEAKPAAMPVKVESPKRELKSNVECVNSTSAVPPLANSTSAVSPLANFTSAVSPLANSTSAVSPLANSTSAVSPLANSTSAVPPLANSTSAFSPLAKASTSTQPITPAVKDKPLTPAKCLIDLLPQGSTVLLSLENLGADCQAGEGFVCVSIHEDYQEVYMTLFDKYLLDCEELLIRGKGEEFRPSPGDALSIFNAEDASWYRARCLSPESVALLDAGKLMPYATGAKCIKLMDAYAQIPEFCCILKATGLKVGDSVKAIINSKCADKCTVSVVDVETDAVLGEGEMTRWLPKVQYPQPQAASTPVAAANAAPVEIPQVPRPPLRNRQEVFLVETAGDARSVLVRCASATAQKDMDMIEQDVALYGLKATPLKEPPTKGQTVVARYTNGNHYRALCKRTSVKQNKYLLEYIEYGNEEVTTLEKLYPCPPTLDLVARPALTSRASLHNVTETLTAPARQYLETIKDQSFTAILTLPDGADTAPSGSPAVLTLTKNRECVNNKLKEMCTPDWKKIEDKGGDVLDTAVVMLSSVKFLELPERDVRLQILDSSMLSAGVLSVCPNTAAALLAEVLGPLTQRMTDYCNSELGRKPYLPRVEEVCLAKFPPFEQWYRAVMIEVIGGAGGTVASVMYLDYGNVGSVPCTDLRKCLAEFMQEPALAINVEIEGIAEAMILTAAQTRRAREFLRVSDAGEGGEVTAARCLKLKPQGSYSIVVPGLLEAIGSV